MKKAKGRRRVKGPAQGGEDSPKRKTVKSDFKGKLSHASPKLTAYFEVESNPEPRTPTVPRKNDSAVLQVANAQTPHRIEMKTEPMTTEVKLGKTKRKGDDSRKITDYFPVRRSERKTKKTVLEEKQRDIEKAVLSGIEDGLAVTTFPGKGRGVVTTRPFAKGDFVVEYAGELISLDEAKTRESIYSRDQNTGCYMYYFVFGSCQYCVDATVESPRLGRLVNHSRNGNLLTKSVLVGGTPRLLLIAKEDIAPGVEVTYDYGDRSRESIKYHPWLAS